MTFLPAADRYEAMQYRRTGRSGLLLPAVSLGLWHNPRVRGTTPRDRSPQQGTLVTVGP